MIFNLLNARRDDTTDTGTYADGAFNIPVIDIKGSSSRPRHQTAHERDYGPNRSIAQFQAGLA